MELGKFSVILGVAVLATLGNAQTPTPSPNFDCPSHDDSIHPDPEDCSKYYVCTNGLAWHEACAPGLLFNPNTLECDWPHLVTCFVTGPTTRPTLPPTTRPSTQTPPTTTPPSGSTTTTEPPVTMTESSTSDGPVPTTTTRPTTQPPTTTPPTGEFQCPSPDGTFPHPEDCNAYYVCEGGHPSLAHCPPGLHFDPILQVCNWPEEAGCTVHRKK